MAEVRYKTTRQTACFSFNKNRLLAEDYVTIKTTAKHEASHLLIANLSALVASYCTEDEYIKAEEDLVIRLEKLLPDA